jgi:hypothetical protein
VWALLAQRPLLLVLAAAGYAVVAVVMPVVGNDHFIFGVPPLLAVVDKVGGFLSPSSVPAASGLQCMAGAKALLSDRRC